MILKGPDVHASGPLFCWPFSIAKVIQVITSFATGSSLETAIMLLC